MKKIKDNAKKEMDKRGQLEKKKDNCIPINI